MTRISRIISDIGVIRCWLLIVDYWLLINFSFNNEYHDSYQSFFCVFCGFCCCCFEPQTTQKDAKKLYNSCYCNLIFLRVLRILWFLSSSDVTDFTDFTDVLWSQRIARIARNYFFYHQMNLMNLMAGIMNYLVNLVNLVIIFQILFVLFVVSVGKIIICYWINFYPLSPKLTNSCNSLIIIDIT